MQSSILTILLATSLGYVTSTSYGRPVEVKCLFSRDCAAKLCGPQGTKTDSRGCPLKGCPCNDEQSFTPPDLSCVCVRAPCPCPIKCPRLHCPVNCEERNGWVLDKVGCNTCKCKPHRCPPVCDIYCEHGNVLDKNGCPTCRCKPGPRICPLRSENSVCRYCPNGYLTDRNGCPTCECKPGPICLPRLCAEDLNCPNGYDTDKNGCTTCTCKPPICRDLLCKRDCPRGYITDKNGCKTCECIPCAIPLCANRCPNGFATKNGCPTCDCKPCPLRLCPARECPYGVKKDKNGCPTCECNCGPVCKIFCPYGNEKDEFGCPICKCKPRPCPLIKCSQQCPRGFEKDENGCQTCKCKCGPLCKKGCPYGFEEDEFGCKICKCKPKPCPLVKCARNCPNGFKTDKNGCQTCDCKCGPVCLIFCEFGNVEDEFGCPTCQCKPRPCDELLCDIHCPHGHVKDKQGCDTCRCNPGPARWSRWGHWSSCPVSCGTGTKRRTRTCSDPTGDGENCPGSDFQTRSCQRRGRSCHECPKLRCFPRCTNGVKKDSNGCDTCSCNPSEKPGQCPALRSPLTTGHRCRRDYDCDGNKKCCSVRPGTNVCVQPVHHNDDYYK